jgi:two-component system phosphate regulon sensor histidine kinase PhoR
MNRKSFALIIALMTISLVGIILVQLFWIKNAVEVKTEQFNRSVNDAMIDVVTRLEKNENLLLLSENYDQIGKVFNIKTLDLDSIREVQLHVTDSFRNKVKKLHVSDGNIEWIENELNATYEIQTFIDSTETSFSYRVDFSDEGGENVWVSKDSIEQNIFVDEDENVIMMKGQNSPSRVVIKTKEEKVGERADALKGMFEKLVVEVESVHTPISARLEKEYLSSLIAKSLNAKGIEVPFEFAVISGSDETLIPVSSENFDAENLGTQFRVSLFPNDLLHLPNFLLINFPDENMHVLRSISLLLLGSLIFTIIILITFTVTIRVILKQKRLADIKSDFINNMTHEFKTPIATISLAVDSINNPKIISLPEKVNYFTNIIRDENRRMNTQVENILQMALIDKRDFNFNIREVDVHEIIERAVKNIRLQVDKKHGEIELALNAKKPIISIDEIHLYNIVNNLLDNAIKYSIDQPQINVLTENSNDGIRISVEDNGVGISKEAKEKIFDKFFRVSSGNIHNVKGFGLGLSYVKAVVLAFGGNVTLESESNKGSRFELYLPFGQIA